MPAASLENYLTAPGPAPPFAIRACEEPDIGAVREIYACYVRCTLISFEIEPPGRGERAARRRNLIAAGYPYFVAERDGEILGYACASAYRPRPAYRYTAENSVYVRRGHARQGVGRRLMEALIAACERKGLRQMVAVIGDGANETSIAFHASLGFVRIGTLRSAGWKFGRWADIVLMQRPLGIGGGGAPE